MATLANDWLEIMKKPAPHIRAGLHKAENILAESRKDFKNGTMLILLYFGVLTLSASLLYLHSIFEFLGTYLFNLLFLLSGMFVLPTFIGLLCIVCSIFRIKKDKKRVQKYIDEHRGELDQSDKIEYDFEILTNTVKNHIRQLSELDILQMLKVKGIQPWAQNLLQKELDQRVATPITVETTLQTYEQACQNTPILRI